MSEEAPGPAAGRRRPAFRNGRPTLTAEAIAEAMLELAGEEGFRSVTMRVLAGHLGVTVRSLYNYVRDRQEVVDRAAALFVAGLPTTVLEPRDWERGLAEHCHALRAVYRRHPRALLVSLDEQLSDAGVPPHRLEQAEAVLAVLRDIGLDLRDALRVHRDLAIRVFGFVLLVDDRNDRGQDVMAAIPVPPGWLRSHPDLDLPHLRDAARAPTPVDTVDDAFAALVEDLLVTVRARLTAPSAGIVDSR